MSEKYKINDPTGIYFITPTIVSWIDVFTKSVYCEIILDSLKYCQKEKGLTIYSLVIMSSHLHLILSAKNENLSDVIRDFKAFTSKKIIEELKNNNDSRKEWILRLFEEAASPLKKNQKYKVWQDGNHPIQLDTNDMFDQRLNYVHDNPVKANIVYHAEEFLYSSAIDYADGKGLIDIVRIE